MKLPILLFIGGFAALQASAAWSQSPRFLSCDIPSPIGIEGSASDARIGPRIFRITPGSFSEWNSRDHEFGPSLCEAFTCIADAKRVEGTISSASMTYKIGVDRATGGGYWRAKGASNLPRIEGSCSLVADPSPPHPK
ncbi:MAG: hypothetical protein V4820_02415 [Pseudomonadota bacterium]